MLCNSNAFLSASRCFSLFAFSEAIGFPFFHHLNIGVNFLII